MKPVTKVIVSILVLGILACGVAAALYYKTFLIPNTAASHPQYLYIPTGTTYNGLLDSLQSNCILRNINSFKKVAMLEQLEGRIKPGRYRIKDGESNKSLVRKIVLGNQEAVNLTISGNIRTLEKLAAILSSKVEADSASFIAVLRNNAIRDSLGFDKEHYLAMFLPNTYQVWWNSSPRTILEKLQKEYNKFWNGERTEKASQIGLSPLEVSTLASIVCEETNKTNEMPRIAGVYINRLHNGIPLQADPTLKFAAGDFTLKRILNIHIEADSPYNTYKNRGLPPGPICVPSPGALDAVLNYERHNYFYFCAKEDFSGYHNFASTLAQHNINAQKYHQALNNAGIR